MNIAEILKDCPKGTKLYSPMFGDVYLNRVDNQNTMIAVTTHIDRSIEHFFFKDGTVYVSSNAECLLFPSKDNRDWSTFKVEKPKFDPKTLKPFDRVLVRENKDTPWACDIFSYLNDKLLFKYQCISDAYSENCIPYNEETKHLVGTTDEAPEFYRI